MHISGGERAALTGAGFRLAHVSPARGAYGLAIVRYRQPRTGRELSAWCNQLGAPVIWTLHHGPRELARGFDLADVMPALERPQ